MGSGDPAAATELRHDLGEGLAGLLCLAALAGAAGGVLADRPNVGEGQAFLAELESEGLRCGAHLRICGWVPGAGLRSGPSILHPAEPIGTDPPRKVTESTHSVTLQIPYTFRRKFQAQLTFNAHAPNLQYPPGITRGLCYFA